MSDKPSPFWNLLKARLLEFFREPAAVFWVYGFPLILAVVLGLAFRNRPVERVKVDIRDDVPNADSLKETLSKDPRIEVIVADEATTSARLRTARTDLVIVPATDGAPVSYLLDPNRPECALARSAAENARLKQYQPNVPLPQNVTFEEPGGRYIDFLVPGLLGSNLMGGGLWGVGFVIVDMRVRKLLKRFLATPMKKQDFLLSLMTSRLIFTLVEVIIFLGFAMVAFDIRVRGSWLAFGVLLVLGATSFAGIGLLVASRAKTIETVSGLMNLVMLPMYLLSGVFFQSERFPELIQPFIKALPLTALNEGLRSVMNDGAGLEALTRPAIVLCAWTIGCFTLASRLFRWS